MDGVMKPAQWFTFDAKSFGDSNSWLVRLTSVAKSLVVHWVRIINKYGSAGGVTFESNEQSCASLLMHIPTPPTSKGGYPQFEIESYTLAEWMTGYYESEEIPAPLKSSDMVAHRCEAGIADLKRKSQELEEEDFIDTVMRAEESNSQIHSAFGEAVDLLQNLPPPTSTVAPLRFDVSRIAPAKMYALDLSPTDLAFFTGDTMTRIEVTLELAGNEMAGWTELQMISQTKAQELQEKIHQLEAMKIMLLEQRQKAVDANALEYGRTRRVEELEASNRKITKATIGSVNRSFSDRLSMNKAKHKQPSTPKAPTMAGSVPSPSASPVYPLRIASPAVPGHVESQSVTSRNVFQSALEVSRALAEASRGSSKYDSPHTSY